MEKNENIFSDELREVLKKSKPVVNVSSINEIQKLVDGEPANINPVKEIREPIIRLYGLVFRSGGGIFFDTEKELIDYIREFGSYFCVPCILDYLGNALGRNDVIRKKLMDSTSCFYTNVSENSYGVYNEERSFYKGEFVWEQTHGDISRMYSEFRNRGIDIPKNSPSETVPVIKKLNETYQEIDRRALNVGLTLFNRINNDYKHKSSSLQKVKK